MKYLFSLLPIVVYLVVLHSQDPLKICRFKTLLFSILHGIGAGLVTLVLFLIVSLENSLATPVIEEMLKGVFVILLAWRKKIGFLTEGVTYGASVGAGFALIENIVYVVRIPELTLLESLMRGFSTALLHIGNTAVVGALTIIVVRELQEKRHIAVWPALVLTPLPSIGLHLLYNAMLLPVMVQIPLALAGYLLILALLYLYDRHLIERWLDRMVDSEINLLTIIHNGLLHTTPTGAYLTSLHSRFSGEEIADIIACFTLHLELSVAAKSRLMLQESGLAEPMTPEAVAANEAKMQEYQAVCQRIGKRGLLALQPIISIHTFDRQAFKVLRF